MINNTIDKKRANKIFKNAVEKDCGSSIEKINTAIRKAAEHCKDSIKIFQCDTGLLIEDGGGSIYSSDYKKLVHYYRKFGYTVEVQNENDRWHDLKIIISW